MSFPPPFYYFSHSTLFSTSFSQPWAITQYTWNAVANVFKTKIPDFYIYGEYKLFSIYIEYLGCSILKTACNI